LEVTINQKPTSLANDNRWISLGFYVLQIMRSIIVVVHNKAVVAASKVTCYSGLKASLMVNISYPLLGEHLIGEHSIGHDKLGISR
jgi:hypothetical protein